MTTRLGSLWCLLGLHLAGLCETIATDANTSTLPKEGDAAALWTKISDLLCSRTLRKGSSTRTDVERLVMNVPHHVTSRQGEVIIVLVAYPNDPWHTPKQAEIEGVDLPDPYPWRPRWIIEFVCSSHTGLLTAVNMRFMEGKFE
jgi:hypothetical protein